MWNEAAHAFCCHDCAARSLHGPGESRACTLTTGWLPVTVACTHHSLPCTPANLASNTDEVHGISWAFCPPVCGGIHLKQLLRSVAPVELVARSCTTVPSMMW